MDTTNLSAARVFSAIEPASDTLSKQQSNSHTPDHFKSIDGVEFAGTHLIIDLWGAAHLSDSGYIEATLKACVKACSASLLHIHTHQFSEGGGISGVAVLAESHISVHTWPERYLIHI